jgi:hypothetical protein
MSDVIILKLSNAPGVVPAPADLEVGELAMNTYDRKLFTKDAGGTVIVLLG